MAGKRRVTRENYYVIRAYANTNSVSEAAQRFSLSYATALSIKNNSTYEEYVENIKASRRESYYKRKGHVAVTAISSPFTDDTNREGTGGTRTIVQEPEKTFKPTVTHSAGDMSMTTLLKACSMAEHGLTKATISRTLGYATPTSFTYFLKKFGEDKVERFEESYKKGEDIRLASVEKIRTQGIKRTRESGLWGTKGTTKPKMTKAEKIKSDYAARAEKAAKNKGMTLEEYRKWQGQKLKEAREKKKEMQDAKNSTEQKDKTVARSAVETERTSGVDNRGVEEPVVRDEEHKDAARSPEKSKRGVDDYGRRHCDKDAYRGIRRSASFFIFAGGVAMLAIAFYIVWRAING